MKRWFTLVLVLAIAGPALAQKPDPAQPKDVLKGAWKIVSPLGAPGAEPESLPLKFYIGLAGDEPSAELRSHVKLLGEAGGLVVRQVLDDSPAAKAGLQTYDVLLNVDGEPVEDMTSLARAVNAAGEAGKTLKLEIVRSGDVQTVEITPAERPEGAQFRIEAYPPGGGGPAWFPADPNAFADPAAFPDPNVVEGMRGGMFAAPKMKLFHGQPGQGVQSSVSIQVQKQNDQPAQVTIERNGEKWTFAEGDEAAIAKLPPDLQATARSISGGNVVVGFPAMPTVPGMPPMPPMPNIEMRDFEKVQQDMEEMMKNLQQQLQEQQKQLEEMQQDAAEGPDV